MILKLVFESITIDTTKEEKIMARPWHQAALLFTCLSYCKMTSEIKYIDKYMLLNVDCNLQSDSRKRNISLFDNRARVHIQEG